MAIRLLGFFLIISASGVALTPWQGPKLAVGVETRGARDVVPLAVAVPVLGRAYHTVTVDVLPHAADLQTLAKSYYAWRDSTYPVATSDLGNHRWDERLADFRLASIRANRRHVPGSAQAPHEHAPRRELTPHVCPFVSL